MALKIFVTVFSLIAWIFCNYILLKDDRHSDNEFINKILTIIIDFEVIFWWIVIIAMNMILWRN